MSYRVIGLNVENKAVLWIENVMRHYGGTMLYARLEETERNFPCRDMFALCGFVRHGNI